MTSIYAEHHRHVKKIVRPSQHDFERKVNIQISSADRFFDFYSLIADLDVALGRDQVLILLFEDGLDANAAKIASQVRHRGSLDVSRMRRENVRRPGAKSWQGSRREPA